MPEAPLIIRGGQAIKPEEIERILLDHPGVAEAAVVGIPDRFWDEIVAAAVTLSAPWSSAPARSAAGGLTAYCRGRLAAHKVPTRWLLGGTLPRTPTGEVYRTTLTARLALMSGPDEASGLEIDGISWLDSLPGLDGLDGSRWTRPATADLRVPPQVRRSRALEDLDYL